MKMLLFYYYLLINICMTIYVRSDKTCGSYICYVQVEILYKLQFVQAYCTRLALQVLTCTEFRHQIISTCTTVLYKLDFKRTLVKLTIFLKIFLILCV